MARSDPIELDCLFIFGLYLTCPDVARAKTRIACSIVAAIEPFRHVLSIPLEMIADNPKGSTLVQVDWQSDQYWRNRRLTPAQLQIHDIRLEETRWRTDSDGMLEMREVWSSTLLPALEDRERLVNTIPYENLTKNRSEQVNLRNLANEYG